MNKSSHGLRVAYQELLPLVDRPGRYIGAERGSYQKQPSAGDIQMALAFPDVYEIGQSHLGLQVLYDLLNRRPDLVAERVYAPWPDMERLLRKRNLPLASLETCTPLGAFDIVGFSLQYELTYTNLLTMLELAGIPPLSEARDSRYPLVIAGGSGAFNAEPIADFIDAFVLGDAEEAILELCSVYRACRGKSRATLLYTLSELRGLYIPSLFRPRYDDTDMLVDIRPLDAHKKVVRKRVLRDLNASPIPKRSVVPSMGVVHERSSIEVMRGCVKGCRFCQAGYVYRPQRERDPRTVVSEATRLIDATGYEELSLLSLSTGDYSCINPVLRNLMDALASRHVTVSLPSTRVDAISPFVLGELRRGRQNGFTLAPEAGTQRMRNIIQKEYDEADLIGAARRIFALGWRNLKLYFMIGLPGETREDLRGIVDLCRQVRAAGPGRPQVTASISTFVPKPHTPFQWAAQIDLPETHARQGFLRRELARYGIRFKWHDARLSTLEGIFSRGDRRLGGLLLAAQRLGCRFDAWTDQCRWDLWQEALGTCGVDAAFYLRRRHLDEVLPWDHIHAGVTKKYLRAELARAVVGALTPDCSLERCTYCGACNFKSLRNVSYHVSGAKGGRHRGHEIESWARDQMPLEQSWTTRSWQQARKRMAARVAHATHTRMDEPQADFLSTTPLIETTTGLERHGGLEARGAGAAEEWLGSPFSRPQASRRGNDPRPRVRLQYAKNGPARFIGSRELAELFCRATRRAGLPIAYTGGHHPLPRLNFSPGLPVGVSSECEFVDIELTTSLDPTTVAAGLQEQLPDGLSIAGGRSISPNAPRIEPSIAGFTYHVEVPREWRDLDRLGARVTNFQASREFQVRKRCKNGPDKVMNSRATTSLRIKAPRYLEVEVRRTPEGTVAPSLLIGTLLGLDDEAIRRLRITKVGTLFHEPPADKAATAAALSGDGRRSSPRRQLGDYTGPPPTEGSLT